MRAWAKRVGTVLLFLAVALLLAPTLLPPFLDRIYYRGPVSGHYDGERFFNPEGEQGTGGSRTRSPLRWIGFLLGQERQAWPDYVAIAPVRPPARVGVADGRPGPMRVTWIGHATVLVQTQGLNILTDPIWSERASPFSFLGPKRVRAPGVRFEDLPRIDLILVSHDHYDHMDLATLKRLWRRDRPLVVTSLGNETVIGQAGVPAVTRDWGGRVAVRPGIDVIVERVHHWGSRWGSDRNRALWSGFTVTLPGGNLFFAGDTGWGDGSWVRDAARDGPYRLALLPIGAYRPRAVMSGNHIGPAEAAEAYRRLGARHALAIHWGTFRLAGEGINQAPEDLARAVAALPPGANGDFRAPPPASIWEIPIN